jgi:hypothetical protein
MSGLSLRQSTRLSTKNHFVSARGEVLDIAVATAMGY